MPKKQSIYDSSDHTCQRLFGTVATVGTGMVSLAVDFRDTFYFDAANELAVFQNQLVHYWILAHIQF